MQVSTEKGGAHPLSDDRQEH